MKPRTFVIAAACAIAAAWLVARARTVPAPWYPPTSALGVAGQAPTGFDVVDGVSYAQVTTARETAPDMAALPLPRDGEFGLPGAPTWAWTRKYLCAGDEALLARIEAVSAGDDGTWWAVAGDCAPDSPLCARAAAAFDAGAPLPTARRPLFASALAGCNPEALRPVADAPWLPLSAHAKWVALHGSTARVDERILSAVEALDGGSPDFDAFDALWRAPDDEAATARLLALHARVAGHRQGLIEVLLHGFRTPAARVFFEKQCREEDAGCGRRPPDFAVLAREWSSGEKSPWAPPSEDGGVLAEGKEALAACALSGGVGADGCLRALADVDWPMAAAAAGRMAGKAAEALRRHPTHEAMAAVLAQCGVDAGPAPREARGPHEDWADGVGLVTGPYLSSLWDTAPELADVPVEEVRAKTAEEQGRLSAWVQGERLDVLLEAGCDVPQDNAAVGLANVVLRTLGSPSRYYQAHPLKKHAAVVLLPTARAACLADAGVLRLVLTAP